jgi:methylthioribose-1-phosphate isomerase
MRGRIRKFLCRTAPTLGIVAAFIVVLAEVALALVALA